MTATPTPLRDTIGHMRDIADVAERYTVEELRDVLREKADELEAALSTRDEAGAVDVAEIRNVAGELRDWRGRQGQPSHTLFSLAERLDDAIATPPASGEAGAVDWTRPIETVKGESARLAFPLDPEGADVLVHVEIGCGRWAYNLDGTPIQSNGYMPRIRNVATPPAASGDDTVAEKWRQQFMRVSRENADLRRLAAVAPAGMDGMAMVPRHLTAENGAKAALIGEFSFRDGSGREHDVPWHVIKQIHRRVVETFAAPTPPATAGQE